MDNKKYLGLFMIILGLALLLAIVYFIFFHDFDAKKPAVEPTLFPVAKEEKKITATTSLPAVDNQAAPPKIAKQEKKVKKEIGPDDLKRMAISFAERFGSYSNQSDYENIKDLRIFMTAAMAAWSDGYIEKVAAGRAATAIYAGVTTTAVANEMKKFDADAGQAEILVRTQRREATVTTGNAANRYEDILISFIKENNVWKVDAARWQK